MELVIEKTDKDLDMKIQHVLAELKRNIMLDANLNVCIKSNTNSITLYRESEKIPVLNSRKEKKKKKRK